LAYHLYPQVIPRLCNGERFGPPRAVRLASPCPWVAHSVSCLIPATARPIQTRFRYGYGCYFLSLATEINSQAHSPKGTPSGIAPRTPLSREHSTLLALRPLVGQWFQVLFHSPHRGAFHLSLTVLVHYRSQSVFSLGEWSPQFPTGLHGSGGTQEHSLGFPAFVYGTITLFGRLSHTFLLAGLLHSTGPTTPQMQASAVWAVPRSLATTKGISLISFPSGTKMFQFPECPS
jgi:hypothetical protein